MRFQTLWEGRAIFAILALVGLAGCFLHWSVLQAPAFLGTLSCLNFFQVSERIGSKAPRDFLSCADGSVTEIVEMGHPVIARFPQP